MSFLSQRAKEPQLLEPRPEAELYRAWNVWRGAGGGVGRALGGPFAVSSLWVAPGIARKVAPPLPGAPPPKCSSSLQVSTGEVGLPAHPVELGGH